jgi:hypothetical protein
MEAYLLLALFVCIIGLAALIAVAITLAERVRHLEWINAKLRKAIKPFDRDGDGLPGGSKANAIANALWRQQCEQFDQDVEKRVMDHYEGRAPNLDPYVKRAVDRANASSRF